MKRLLIVLCVAGLLATIPLYHVATAAKPEEKVNICHIIAANDVVPQKNVLYYFGKEISVARAAVPAHEAHGDSQNFVGGIKAAHVIAKFKLVGANLPAADCYFIKHEGPK